MERKDRITSIIKRHDRLLYCDYLPQGGLAIFRQLYRYEPMEVDGNIIHYQVSSPHLVFALTHTWSVNGRSVDWGIEPIMQKLRMSDLWRSDDIISELTRDYDKGEQSRARHTRNQIESFVKDFRPQFAKATEGINTGTLDKKKDRRYKDDLKIKEN